MSILHTYSRHVSYIFYALQTILSGEISKNISNIVLTGVYAFLCSLISFTQILDKLNIKM